VPPPSKRPASSKAQRGRASSSAPKRKASGAASSKPRKPARNPAALLDDAPEAGVPRLSLGTQDAVALLASETATSKPANVADALRVFEASSKLASTLAGAANERVAPWEMDARGAPPRDRVVTVRGRQLRSVLRHACL
jgi:hypothetical protein